MEGACFLGRIRCPLLPVKRLVGLCVNMRLSPERKVKILRDVACLVIGLGGIIYQQITGQFNLTLLIVFTSLVGGTGVTSAIGLLKESGRFIDLRSPTSQYSDSQSDSNKLQKSSDGNQ